MYSGDGNYRPKFNETGKWPKSKNPIQTRAHEQGRIREILRKYCEDNGLPYTLTTQQAVDALRESHNVVNAADLNQIFRRWWLSGINANDVLQRFRE